jgi:hypothetical protein
VLVIVTVCRLVVIPLGPLNMSNEELTLMLAANS